MKNAIRLLIVLSLSVMMAWAVIPRASVFAGPDTSMNVGGWGAMVAGMDIDGDGAKEIYLVNDNWNDGDAGELIPRIYKLERAVGETDYQVVWEANAQDFEPGITQNTWPVLSVTDLDGDGKMELTWGIVNAGSGNPGRIWVYEHVGGDNFGLENPTTNKWEPHSVTTIVDADGINCRPISWEIFDIDDDGVDEIVFASRKSGLRWGVISVDDIPDDGAGTESWDLEFSETDVTDYDGDNKWDVAVISNEAYLFDEVKISKISHSGTAYEYTSMDPLPGGITFDSAESFDVDGDGVEEILTCEYYYGDATRNLWLLEAEGDTLKRTALFDLSGEDYLNGGRMAGGDCGDIDNDGNVDFIFGSRYAGPPNAMMLRVEYDGDGAISDPLNWELTIADTSDTVFAPGTNGIWNVIDVANVDEDPEDEIVYTSSVSMGDYTFPIIILDSNEYTTDVHSIFNATSFELGQAYPNPFNPAAVIPFTLNTQGRVSLSVYNTKGQLVDKLISNKTMEAGSHSILFNASDLASGVYMYQLRVDNTVRAGRMVLNK